MTSGPSKPHDGVLSKQREGATNRSARILLAEDDREMRRLLAWRLREEGYVVTECADGLRLLDELERYLSPELGSGGRFDLVVSDIRMPGVTGMEVLEAANQSGGFPPMILITAFGDDETHARAKRCGAVALFDKPFELEQFVARVKVVVPV